jgi:hopanoid biosynthesis associated radical SAM protein HpnH
MPLRQSLRVGSYLMRQKLAGNKKFPLLVELEPLFACNLKCAGCGKIQQPHTILKQRMPVEQAIGAVEESGAPMVSIAGGEPLMHPQIDVIVSELIKRKKFVFLCTNALLLPKKLDKFKPSPYFAWVVHIDGLRERHDESVCKDGVFDEAVAAIKLAKSRGFKVNTNTTVFNTDTPQTVIDVLTYLNDDLGIDEMQISPAYAYEKAPDQEHFLGVEETRELFRKAFADGRRKKWRLNHTPLFLDFLEGKTDFGCTAWGIPSYSLLGWQKPCYLMNDGYVKTYKELIETTDWDSYGRGKDPRCANCMAHCGYEPSAVLATMSSLRETIRAARGNLSPLAGLAAAKAEPRVPRLYREGPAFDFSRPFPPPPPPALRRLPRPPQLRSLPGRFTAPPSTRRQSPSGARPDHGAGHPRQHRGPPRPAHRRDEKRSPELPRASPDPSGPDPSGPGAGGPGAGGRGRVPGRLTR